MSYEVDISPEERAEIIRSVPIRLPDRKAEPTMDQILDKEEEELREKRRQARYARQLELEHERQERVAKNDWFALTGGRHELLDYTKEKMCLWRDGKCTTCDKNCKYVLEGWNPNVIIANLELGVPYESDQINDQNNFTQKHSCYSKDPATMNIYLKKRIEHLENNLKTLDKSVDDRIRQAFIINSVGR